MSGLEPGFQLGHYRIIRSLGSGGMADVYEAHDEHLERTVALKILPIEYCRNPQLVQRFQKEVRAAARLNHRNIVTVFEVGQQDSWHFFSMRLLTGGDLRKRIEEGLTPVESLAILREVADAFSHAHARGFVHRDVKPENIMFDEQGFPVLTDFGIAKALDANTHMTRTGMTMGTPRYLSPEQASGKPVDARADLYSLGVILHEMLTGRPPYDAEEAMAVIFKHVTEPIPVLPPDFGRYQALLEKLMAKDPNQRVSSAADLIKEIDAIVPRQATGELKQSQLRTAENPLIARLMTPSPLRTPPPKTPRPMTPPPLTPATPVVRDMTGEVIVRAPPVTNRGAAVRPATPVSPAREQPAVRPAAAVAPPAPAAAPVARGKAPLWVGGTLAAAALAAVAFFALRPTTQPATVAAPVTTPAPAVDAQAQAERARRDAEQKQAAERYARQQAEAETRKRAEQEAARTRATEDLQARQRSEAEAQRRAAAEAEAQRRASIEAEARKRAEAQAEARRREQAEAEARKRAADDAARRQAADEESLSAAEIERRAREADRAKAAARGQKAGEPQPSGTKAAKKDSPAPAPTQAERTSQEEEEAEALERARRPTGF